MIGITYFSVDGHTKKICGRLLEIFKSKGIVAELIPITELDLDVSKYQTLVIGASIRYGKHSKEIIQFIQKNKSQLKSISTAFFSVNLVARKPDKNRPDTNPYLIKFLKESSWEPDFKEVFAGKLDYSVYPFWDKIMIKLIMKMTDGPTSTDSPIDYTDWERVDSFGNMLVEYYSSSTHNQ